MMHVVTLNRETRHMTWDGQPVVPWRGWYGGSRVPRVRLTPPLSVVCETVRWKGKPARPKHLSM